MAKKINNFYKSKKLLNQHLVRLNIDRFFETQYLIEIRRDNYGYIIIIVIIKINNDSYDPWGLYKHKQIWNVVGKFQSR